MQAPWKNPRSENLWFRRRVPSNLVGYMGKREIKFSLGTADPVLARIRFQEENAKLERVWHEHLHGQEYAKLSQRQLSALAGQFYQEMIAAHSDNPGRAFDWQLMVKRDQERIAKRFPLKGRVYHMRETFGGEARAFLEKKGYRLSGETLDMFIEEFVRTKLQAAEQLVRNASFTRLQGFSQRASALLRSRTIAGWKGSRSAFQEGRGTPGQMDQERGGGRDGRKGGSEPWLAPPLLFAGTPRRHAHGRPEHHPGTRRREGRIRLRRRLD